MALKIRLARGGAKKRPFYRIVVAESSSPRDGRFIEKVGTYNPLLPHGHADRTVLDHDRIKYWLSVGAQPTDRVELFLGNAGIVEKKDRAPDPKKSAPKKRAQERQKAEQEALAALKKAEETAAEVAPAPAPVEEAAINEPEVPASVPEEAPVSVEKETPAIPDETPVAVEKEAPAIPEEAPVVEEATPTPGEEKASPAE
ncbi:MAG: ribosomal protein [Alphaproteobacteria bacterium]|jgi:small subunit ribosomal protein S16|nr:ribosomal protein [Alphaproteobacteria bacterium]